MLVSAWVKAICCNRHPIANRIFIIITASRYLINYMTSISYPKYFLELAYVVLILISLILMITRWKKRNKQIFILTHGLAYVFFMTFIDSYKYCI